MTITSVLFDLDDTLLWDERSVREAFRATCEAAAAEAPGVDPSRLEAAVRKQARALYESYETYGFTKSIGINPFEGLWADFSGGEHPMFRKLQAIAPAYRTQAWTFGLKEVGIDNPELGERLGKQFPKERRARPFVYEDTFGVLDQLKPHYRLLLLTNGSPDLQQEKLDGVPKLPGYFEHILISGAFGIGKPDPSIFRHALELLQVEPSEAVMVGDKLTTDILGSYRTGIRNVWINRHGVPFEGEARPTYEIDSLSGLPELLSALA